MDKNIIKLCLADDHPIVVEGLKEVLNARDNFEVIGEAFDGREMLSLLKQRRPDVIIMDGITCTKHVKQQYPFIKIIILTMYTDRAFVNQLIAAGADGCMLKSRGSKELITAIERVTSNKSYFDTVSDFVSHTQEKEEIQLSEREREIVKLVAEGLTSSDIAQKLYIAEHTVRTHRKNIFKKLGINNTSQLTRFAINNRII
jgi:DNA-binding NarL/FixJ family response regulator